MAVPLLRDLQRLLPAAELHTPYGMTEALPVTDISLPEIEQAGLGNGVCVGLSCPAFASGSARSTPGSGSRRAAAYRQCHRGDLRVGRTRQGPLRPAVGDRAGQLARPRLAPHRRCRPPGRRRPAVGRGPAGPRDHRRRRTDHPGRSRTTDRGPSAGDRGRARRRRPAGHPAAGGRRHDCSTRAGGPGGRGTCPCRTGRRGASLSRPC